MGRAVDAVAALWLRQNSSSQMAAATLHCAMAFHLTNIHTRDVSCHLSTHRRADDADRSERTPKKSHSRDRDRDLDRDRRGDGHGRRAGPGTARGNGRGTGRRRGRNPPNTSSTRSTRTEEKSPLPRRKSGRGGRRRRRSGAKKNGGVSLRRENGGRDLCPRVGCVHILCLLSPHACCLPSPSHGT